MNFIYYLLIFTPSLLWAIVNHVDKLLVEKYCKDQNVGSLMIFSSIIGIPVSFISFFLAGNVFDPELSEILLMIIAGIIYIIALIPYLYALQLEETSEVAPIMIVTPIFSLILSFFLLGEVLSFIQIISIFITLFGAGILSFDLNGMSKFGFKFKPLMLMLVACMLLALNAVLFKYNNIEANFFTNIFWTHIGFIIVGIILLSIKRFRLSFIKMTETNRVAIWTVNSISEILTVMGNIFFSYVSLLFPIAFVQSLTEGAQPLFVLLLGVLGTLFFPKYISENLTKNNILKKLIGIIIMIIGFMLINI